MMGADHLRVASPEVEDRLAHAGWILDAGNPYFEWLLGGPSRSRSALRDWLDSPQSELSADRIRAVRTQSGETIGGFIAIAAEDLAACRKNDLVRMMRSTPSQDRAGLMERLRTSRDAFAPVAPDRLYLSRIGLSPRHRGRGLGVHLVDAFLGWAQEAGHRRLRLDVCAANEPALRAYRRRGFEIVDRRRLQPLDVDYLAMERIDADG